MHHAVLIIFHADWHRYDVQDAKWQKLLKESERQEQKKCTASMNTGGATIVSLQRLTQNYRRPKFRTRSFSSTPCVGAYFDVRFRSVALAKSECVSVCRANVQNLVSSNKIPRCGNALHIVSSLDFHMPLPFETHDIH